MIASNFAIKNCFLIDLYRIISITFEMPEILKLIRKHLFDRALNKILRA
jgi:hypothetical protein